MVCEQCGEIIIGNVSYCKKCGCPVANGVNVGNTYEKEKKVNSNIKRIDRAMAEEEKYCSNENEWLILTGRFNKESRTKRSELPLFERINIELLMKLDLIGFEIGISLTAIIFLLILILVQLMDGIRVW